MCYHDRPASGSGGSWDHLACLPSVKHHFGLPGSIHLQLSYMGLGRFVVGYYDHSAFRMYAAKGALTFNATVFQSAGIVANCHVNVTNCTSHFAPPSAVEGSTSTSASSTVLVGGNGSNGTNASSGGGGSRRKLFALEDVVTTSGAGWSTAGRKGGIGQTVVHESEDMLNLLPRIVFADELYKVDTNLYPAPTRSGEDDGPAILDAVAKTTEQHDHPTEQHDHPFAALNRAVQLAETEFPALDVSQSLHLHDAQTDSRDRDSTDAPEQERRLSASAIYLATGPGNLVHDNACGRLRIIAYSPDLAVLVGEQRLRFPLPGSGNEYMGAVQYAALDRSVTNLELLVQGKAYFSDGSAGYVAATTVVGTLGGSVEGFVIAYRDSKVGSLQIGERTISQPVRRLCEQG